MEMVTGFLCSYDLTIMLFFYFANPIFCIAKFHQNTIIPQKFIHHFPLMKRISQWLLMIAATLIVVTLGYYAYILETGTLSFPFS